MCILYENIGTRTMNQARAINGCCIRNLNAKKLTVLDFMYMDKETNLSWLSYAAFCINGWVNFRVCVEEKEVILSCKEGHVVRHMFWICSNCQGISKAGL